MLSVGLRNLFSAYVLKTLGTTLFANTNSARYTGTRKLSFQNSVPERAPLVLGYLQPKALAFRVFFTGCARCAHSTFTSKRLSMSPQKDRRLAGRGVGLGELCIRSWEHARNTVLQVSASGAASESVGGSEVTLCTVAVPVLISTRRRAHRTTRLGRWRWLRCGLRTRLGRWCGHRKQVYKPKFSFQRRFPLKHF